MSRIICGVVRLLRKLDDDSALEPGSVEVSLLPITLKDHVDHIIEYFSLGTITLKGIDLIRLEGSEVSPIFTGGRIYANQPIIPLAFTIISYEGNDDSYIVRPLGLRKPAKDTNIHPISGVEIKVSNIRDHMAWYLARGSLYPFAIIRLFKIFYSIGGIRASKDLLEKLYASNRETLTNTLSILKVPSKPDIPCNKDHNAYLVLYRCSRAFASSVLEPQVVRDICSNGSGLIIDHHVSYMITYNMDAAYYYSALLNYMIYKTRKLGLGTFIRDQFGRPLKAVKEAGLEWGEEQWQLDVARASIKIHECARRTALEVLGLPDYIQLYELVDEGRDELIKRSLGVRVDRVLRTLEERCGFNNIVRSIDDRVDDQKLAQILRRNIASHRSFDSLPKQLS
ncbi:MAG TPA: hypothetical protein VNL13_04730 [Sulfolobales archaeon]|nr:hypothetical protein [Sulfolobales archaeon]